ncbi:membrane protein [Gordonia phage Widow]|nr:membrane protein [Gordonia phage Widow]
MSWSLVGQIVVLTLLALAVFIIVTGAVLGLVNHWRRDPELPTHTGSAGNPPHTHPIPRSKR